MNFQQAILKSFSKRQSFPGFPAIFTSLSPNNNNKNHLASIRVSLASLPFLPRHHRTTTKTI